MDEPGLKGFVVGDMLLNIEGVVLINGDCEVFAGNVEPVFAGNVEPVVCPNAFVGNRLEVVPKAPVELEELENGFTGAGC